MNNLATVSLSNPVKIFVNDNKDVAFNLQQEFVRIRPHMEGDREAVVAGKCRSRLMVIECVLSIFVLLHDMLNICFQ